MEALKYTQSWTPALALAGHWKGSLCLDSLSFHLLFLFFNFYFPFLVVTHHILTIYQCSGWKMRTGHVECKGYLQTDILAVVDHLCKVTFLLNLFVLSVRCHLPYLSVSVSPGPAWWSLFLILFLLLHPDHCNWIVIDIKTFPCENSVCFCFWNVHMIFLPPFRQYKLRKTREIEWKRSSVD